MPVKERVLVVDDEELNRNGLSRRLERSGFEVEVADGGVDALRKMHERPFDLILLDQMMPGKSGSEVLRELRIEHSAAALPVIMVTAVTDSNRVAESLELGANDYITKPVDFTVALARIRAQLSRKHSETARRLSDERYELVARAANDGLWDWDLKSNQIYYSSRWKAMLGWADSEIGNSPEEWFSRVHADDIVALRLAIDQHLESGSEAFEADYRLRKRDGQYRWMTVRGAALRDSGGKAVRMAGSQSDVTQKKTTDALTGLPNRILLHDRLGAALEQSHKPASEDGKAGAGKALEGFAVYFVDLDRFKLINDTLGHAAGDQLLVQFSRRLRLAVEGTNSVVARMGGDEFALLVEDIGTAGAIALGKKLIESMRPVFHLGDGEFFISGSVGIVNSEPSYMTVGEMLRDADIAMYAAKSRGRGRVAVFDESMRQNMLDRLQTEMDLRMALPRGQFEVYYQPRVDLHSDRIWGFEALVRWNHPKRGLVQPDEFIRIAEETGMIREIGLWVLGEACEQIHSWRAQFPDMPWLDVAVNVSPVQLRDPDLAKKVAQILSDTGLEAHGLQIEITESTFLDNVEDARVALMSLKGLGVGLKLDDFATGYSCLRYLQGLPFDTIKIDRSFTSDLDAVSSESRELIRTILAMAQNLSLDVIAEGVENQVAADFLRDSGCKFGQGYHFSPPVNANLAETMLSNKIVSAPEESEAAEKPGQAVIGGNSD